MICEICRIATVLDPASATELLTMNIPDEQPNIVAPHTFNHVTASQETDEEEEFVRHEMNIRSHQASITNFGGTPVP